MHDYHLIEEHIYSVPYSFKDLPFTLNVEFWYTRNPLHETAEISNRPWPTRSIAVCISVSHIEAIAAVFEAAGSIHIRACLF